MVQCVLLLGATNQKTKTPGMEPWFCLGQIKGQIKEGHLIAPGTQGFVQLTFVFHSILFYSASKNIPAITFPVWHHGHCSPSDVEENVSL